MVSHSSKREFFEGVFGRALLVTFLDFLSAFCCSLEDSSQSSPEKLGERKLLGCWGM